MVKYAGWDKDGKKFTKEEFKNSVLGSKHEYKENDRTYAEYSKGYDRLFNKKKKVTKEKDSSPFGTIFKKIEW